LYDMMMVDKHGGYITPDTPQDATYTMYGSFEMGKQIDIFTQYPAPYGGQGLDQWSDMFWPQKLVCLYAYVSYNCWPLQQKLVEFTIRDNNGTIFTVLTAPTNASGVATVCFRMPWPCIDPESWFGTWSATADVDIACTVVNDTVWWHYDYLINNLKITVNRPPPQTYLHGEWVCVCANFSSYARQTYRVNLYFGLLDNLSYPVAIANVTFDIGGPWNPQLACHYYNYSECRPLFIPKWAASGWATVYVTPKLWWDGRYQDNALYSDYQEAYLPYPYWVAAGPMATTKIYILPA
jgi:hypothetical protein